MSIFLSIYLYTNKYIDLRIYEAIAPPQMARYQELLFINGRYNNTGKKLP